MLRLSLTALISLQFTAGVYSQTYNPPSHPEKNLASSLSNGIATLGTAMIESPALDTVLSAITYSDYGSTKLHLELGDGLAGLDIFITSGIWAAADVAIADEPGPFADQR